MTYAVFTPKNTSGLVGTTIEQEDGTFQYQVDASASNMPDATALADTDTIPVFKDGVLSKITVLDMRKALGLPYAMPFSFPGFLAVGDTVTIPVKSGSPTIKVIQIVIARADVGGLSGYTALRVSDAVRGGGGSETPISLLCSAVTGKADVDLTVAADANVYVFVDDASGGHANLQGYLILRNE